MTCRWVQDRLILYLAGEASQRDAAKVVRHLERCSACMSAAEALAEAQEAVANAVRTSVVPPSTLDQRAMAQVRSESLGRHWARARSPIGLPRLVAACASACLLVLAFWSGALYARRTAAVPVQVVGSGGETLSLAGLETLHGRELGASAAAVPSVGAESLSKLLSGKVPFKFHVLALDSQGARLVGGGAETAQGQPIVRLTYGLGSETVSLFQTDAMKLALPALRQMQHAGPCYVVGKIGRCSYVVWCRGMTNYIMMSRVKPERLLELAHSAERAMSEGKGSA